jgi:error-prone DNA polymerase
VIQWDKNDLDALGLLKVDVLALGMLSAIHRALDLVGMPLAGYPARRPGGLRHALCRRYGRRLPGRIAGADGHATTPQTTQLLRSGDRSGTGQAGPDPGRHGPSLPASPARPGSLIEPMRPEIAAVLGRTCGVPIFQEQVMQLAVVAGGFTPGEADQLRRAMAAWRRKGGLEPFEEKLITGMRHRSHDEAFAQRIFARRFGAFGEYGFPESHAASFALLVYVSAWLKRHHPAAFLCALLNSQPMGFYSPSQLVQDARRHGVRSSAGDGDRQPLGSRTRKSWDRSTIAWQQARRPPGSWQHRQPLADRHRSACSKPADSVRLASVADLATRAQLVAQGARAARGCRRAGQPRRPPSASRLGSHRRRRTTRFAEQRRATAGPLSAAELPDPSEADDLVADYASTGLTLGHHPLILLRTRLAAQRYVSASQLQQAADRQLHARRRNCYLPAAARYCQRDCFCHPGRRNRAGQRRRTLAAGRAASAASLLGARLLGVLGQVQREGHGRPSGCQAPGRPVFVARSPTHRESRISSEPEWPDRSGRKIRQVTLATTSA